MSRHILRGKGTALEELLRPQVLTKIGAQGCFLLKNFAGTRVVTGHDASARYREALTMSARLWHLLCPDHSKYVIRHLFLFSYSRICASSLTVARSIAPCGTESHAASSVKRVGNALG